MQPLRMSSKITIALPDSILENEDTLLLKTMKIGSLSRTITMFRVAKLLFYQDSSNFKDKKILNDLFTYLQCPPYLRKYLPSIPNLRYTAILPPLHSPNHTGVCMNDITFIAGRVNEQNSHDGKIIVDIGKKTPLYFPQGNFVNKGQFVIIKKQFNDYSIEKGLPFDGYWYTQHQLLELPLNQFLKKFHTQFYVIGASKSGENISKTHMNLLKMGRNSAYLLAFGPLKGVFRSYVKEDNLIDKWINFVPNQATKTVKIEEALHSALSIMNMYSLDFK